MCKKQFSRFLLTRKFSGLSALSGKCPTMSKTDPYTCLIQEPVLPRLQRHVLLEGEPAPAGVEGLVDDELQSTLQGPRDSIVEQLEHFPERLVRYSFILKKESSKNNSLQVVLYYDSSTIQI